MGYRRTAYHEVDTAEELADILRNGGTIKRCAFQSVDFTAAAKMAENCKFEHCMFMGCRFTKDMKGHIDGTNLVFSHIEAPFNAFRNSLYTAATLYDGYRVGESESYTECYDNRVYQHYLHMGKTATDMKEKLARILHDHSISNAMHDLLGDYDERMVVGIMGGHGLTRTDKVYKQIALISKSLTENGRLMVSGGGPGAMEATHLGAWMAGRTTEELNAALTILAEAPTFDSAKWIDTAFRVRGMFPQERYRSLGVPTWLYGHEPATPLATHIAKYFENAIREDGILTIAMGGIIYAPGSAGTMQEIFQDAVQNHYLSFGYASPMVFLGTDYWTREMPVYPMLQSLMASGRYKNLLLSIGDSENETVKALKSFK